MTDKLQNPPAFPSHEAIGHSDPRNQISGGGMTLRDWFAGQSLTSVILKCNELEKRDSESIAGLFARRAYEVADAMLAARQGGDHE